MNFVTGIAACTILFLTSIRAIPANCFLLDKEGWGGLIAVRSQNGMTKSSFPILLKTTPSYQEYVKNQIDGHPMETTGQESQFRHIEQPIELKLAVTLGGLVLIGLEVWWFLLSQTVSTTEKNK